MDIMMGQEIGDSGSFNKYFSLMLHMDDDDLDPFQYRLLGHYRRVCGANHGLCFERVDTTAARCKMTDDKVREARAGLITAGYLKVVERPGQTTLITIMDRMGENIARYTNPSRNQDGLQVDTPPKNGTAPVPESGHKEEPIKEEISPNDESLGEAPTSNKPIARVRKSKPKAAPGKKTNQAHVELIEAWMNAVGKDTIPPGVTVRPFVRLGKTLLTAGVTPAEMTCAGDLYRAWYDALTVKPTLDWRVDTVTLDIRRALLLCKEGIAADRIGPFVRSRLAETDPKTGRRFWAGKLLSFEYVGNHIKEAQPVERKEGQCWFDGDTGNWKRIHQGKLQRREVDNDVWEAA